jgi:hypothetical protein
MNPLEPALPKCDFCFKEAIAYGSFQCYMACEDHLNEGEQLENEMWEAMENCQDE